MPHHHSAEDWAFLEHLESELDAQLRGQDACWLCPDCGREVWVDALDGTEHPPRCCGWEMVGLPRLRERG